MKPYQELPMRQYLSLYSGGLTTQDEPTKIPINGSPDLLNVRPIGQGAYGPRNGIARIGEKITGIGYRSGIFNFSKGLTEILVSPRGTTIEYLKTSDNTWHAFPGIGAYTLGAKFGFANDNKYLYFCNAVEDFAIWDGKDLTGTITVNVDNTITSNAHGLELGDLVTFTTTTTLPAGLTVGVVYFVIAGGLTANTFKVSTTYAGTEVDITDTGTGTHTFASSIKTYSSNPKGNIMQFYRGRLFIAGILSAPTTIQWSVINILGTTPPFDFAGSNSGTYVFSKDGGYITAMRSFTLASGAKILKIFKKTQGTYNFLFDDNNNQSVDDGEQDTGAINQKSTMNVENDILYVDNGNNIANLGFRENIQNQVRTDSTTTGLDRTTNSLDFSDVCSVYWKKRKMALYAGKSYGSDFNDTILAYFYDFKSWWRWSGINATEFTIYKDEIVWASSVDLNVYKYDETRFDDNVDDEDSEGAGTIQSYRHSKDIEYGDQNGVAYSDRYKKARYATFKGYISPSGVMEVGVMYDANEDKKSVVSFSGIDENITEENVSIYFGANMYGSQAFGGSALSPTAFPMREFFVVVSLDYYSNLRARLITKVNGAGAPYVITHQALYTELEEIEVWPDGIRI